MKNLFILFLFCGALFGAVPTEFVYQGRFLHHETGQELKGTITADFLVRLRLTSQPGLNPVTFQQKISGVKVTDGLFTLIIDTSKNELTGYGAPNFSEPYSIEVLIGGTAGGKVGSQVFHSLPYAFAAQETALLSGLRPEELALASHEHSTPATHYFTIDGSQYPKATANQFVIKNSAGTNVLAIDEDGLLQSVRAIWATSTIESREGFQLKSKTDSPNAYPVMITKYGDLTASGSTNPLLNEIPGNLSVAGTIYCTKGISVPNITGTTYLYSLQDLQITREGRILLSGSRTGIDHKGSVNVIGLSHTIEQHNQDTPMYSRLVDLTTVGFEANSLHTHTIATGSVSVLPRKTSFGQVPAVEEKHFQAGTLSNRHFAEGSISDSMLGDIKTAGKITGTALGVEVARITSDNNFLAEEIVGEPPAGYDSVTNVDFDAIRLKNFLLTSDLNINESVAPILNVSSPDGGIPNAELFSYKFMSNGDLQFNYSSADTGFEFTRDGQSAHKIIARNVRVQHSEASRHANFFYGGAGGMIQALSITGADFANNSIDTSFLQDASFSDSGIASAKFTDGVISTIKLAGAISGRAFAPSSITSGLILSVGPDNIASNSLSNVHFATSDALLDRHFIRYEGLSTGDISGDKICGRDAFGNKEACLDSEKFSPVLISEQSISDGAITRDKIRAANILLDKLSSDVLEARTQSIKITLGETEDSHLSLLTDSKDLPLLFYTEMPDSSGAPVVKLEDKDGLTVSSINSNGTVTLGLRDTVDIGNYNNFELNAAFLAMMTGVETEEGNCGNNDFNMRALSYSESGANPRIANCISRQNNHGGVALTYWQAKAFCAGQGYDLCSVDVYYANCRREVISSGTFMTDSFLQNGGDKVVNFVINTAGCTTDVDFDIATAADTGYNFRCCLR